MFPHGALREYALSMRRSSIILPLLLLPLALAACGKSSPTAISAGASASGYTYSLSVVQSVASSAPSSVQTSAQPAASGDPAMQLVIKYWPGFDPSLFDRAPAPDCSGAPADQRQTCIADFYCKPASADKQAACRAEAAALPR
jgi:hypothetical protein